MNERRIGTILRGTRVEEGAGVMLRRLFAHAEAGRFDPFLLFDDFGSTDPQEYVAGFPWHPHRGIETVTLMLAGRVEHGDSIGNRGTIGPGDVQWMSAGGGIIHQEMPQADPVCLRGFQLWVNLPAAHKLTPPRYRGITAAEIPAVAPAPGVTVKIISGECGGRRGIVSDLVVPVLYHDVNFSRAVPYTQPVPPTWTGLVYCYAGQLAIGDTLLTDGELGVLTPGDGVTLQAQAAATSCLLLAGQPVGEPIAWDGPIVMNTAAELETAFREYRNGTFLTA
ncbi:MAG TPA: pirin family protein [bacterium]|nr:pirin family protein [bacterium]